MILNILDCDGQLVDILPFLLALVEQENDGGKCTFFTTTPRKILKFIL